MKQTWKDYEDAPGPLAIGLKVVGAIFVLLIVIAVPAYFLGWCGEAAQVTKDEMGPRAAIRKYSWFKDAAQQLEAKRANILAMETDLLEFKKEWMDTPWNQWPRDVRESIELRRSEILGLKANYNDLAAQYNANVRKVNWKVFNTDGLPDEFTTYITH